MVEMNPAAITVDEISFPFQRDEAVGFHLLRLDKIHPLVSGNKWFKLRHYLEQARALNKKRIVSFGGAWSNHLLATAAACQQSSLQSAGIVRGESKACTPVLQQCADLGMQLIFRGRKDFANRDLPAPFEGEENFLIPAGGYGEPGARGAGEILRFEGAEEFTHVCCAVGSGTTLGGLLSARRFGQVLIGISVMKNNFDLVPAIQRLATNENENWKLIHDFHFGGFARHRPELIDFMNGFYRRNGVPTDFVYTGKLLFAVAALHREQFFPAGSRVLIIHSGGLTGNLSLGKGTLIF